MVSSGLLQHEITSAQLCMRTLLIYDVYIVLHKITVSQITVTASDSDKLS